MALLADLHLKRGNHTWWQLTLPCAGRNHKEIFKWIEGEIAKHNASSINPLPLLLLGVRLHDALQSENFDRQRGNAHAANTKEQTKRRL